MCNHKGHKRKIQQELSRSLGVPLKIRSMSVTPWGGLELSGITIPQTVSVGPRDFLKARTFRLRVRFLSLFSRRLVIKEVSLVGPRVVWPQNTEGKWRLPDTRAARSHTVSTNQAPATSQCGRGTEFVQTNTTPAVSNAAGVPSPPKPTVKNEPPGSEPTFAVAPEVRRVSVKDGDFTFLDQTGKACCEFCRSGFSHQHP